MTRADVFSISLKLAAVYVWIQGLHSLALLGLFVRQLYEPDQPAFFVLAPFFAGVLMLAGVGAALWFSSGFLAARLEGGHTQVSLADRAGIGALGLRIGAILIVDRAIGAVFSALFQVRVARLDHHWGGVWTNAAVVALLLAISAWMFLCAEGIAARFFAKGAPSSTESRYGALQAVAFSVAGLCILVAALPSFVPLVTAVGLDWTNTIQAILRVALGAVLFFGGNTLARLWLRIRNAVVEPKSRPV
ncbi:MAG TPA: hypothetical protein VGR31_17020 [Planctomycetota bacterium]|jgi:hypothetical protein|nr:hypothetical protein [Planctomycetota bacterium]